MSEMSRNPPSKFSEVLLSPIQDAIMNDQNLEPQFMRKRHGNNSYLYMDTADRNENIEIIQKFIFGSKNNLFSRKIKRFAVDFIKIDYNSPNVNIYNNQVTFFSTASGLNHTVVVPIGFYDFSSFAPALQTALNTATGASGLTWTITPSTNGQLQYTLATAGGNYHFIVDPVLSPMVVNGHHLVNLPYDQTNTASKTAGSVNMYYTRYIDIVSFALLQYDKNPTNTTRFGTSNLLVRLFIRNPTISQTLDFAIQNVRWVNFDITQSLTNIDISILDEFGNPLYIPFLSTGSAQNSDLILTLLTEL